MKATLLTSSQTFGYPQKEQLQVLKDYGTKTGMSDLAVMLGGAIGLGGRTPYKTSDGQRTGYVYTSSDVYYGNGDVSTVGESGGETPCGPKSQNGGIRPALSPEITATIVPDKNKTLKIGPTQNERYKQQFWPQVPLADEVGIKIVEYGEYPQTLAADTDDLENKFKNTALAKTGKQYNFGGGNQCDEYQYGGRKFIRVEAQSCDDNSVLANGNQVHNGAVGWIEVQPVEWLADQSGWWVTRQALVSGVQFDKKQKYEGKFDDTDANKFINEVMLKEMLPERDRSKVAGVTSLTRADGNNWTDSLGDRSGRKIGE